MFGFLFSTFAQALPPSINLGFYPENSSIVPQSVLSARAKIFQIQMPYYYKIKNEDFQAYLDLPNLTEKSRDHLNDCARQNEVTCTVEMFTINGTAFLDSDPSAIWTNCHIVSNWMGHQITPAVFSKTSELFSAVRATRLPLTLIDYEGNIAVDGRAEDEFAFVDAFSRMRAETQWSNRCNGMDDMVKIKLNRNLSETGLERTRQKPLNGELVYIGGIPKPSQREVEGVDMSSDGVNFYWAYGEFFDKESEDFQQYFPQMSFAFSGYKQAFFADGAQGMSGSPVLNASGQVVGIYQAYVPSDAEDEESLPLVSMYTDVAGMRFVEILSE